LSQLLPEPERVRSQALYDSWSENWSGLGTDDDRAVATIDGAINDFRKDVLEVLASLD